MKQVFTVFVLLVLSLCLFAQAPNWQMAAQAGGSNYAVSYSIANDNEGNSFVAGYFQNSISFGSYNLTGTGMASAYVAKMDNAGNWLWARVADGSGMDTGVCVVADNNGNCYVIGNFQGTANFGEISLTCNVWDTYVAKLDSNGNWLWAVKAGGSAMALGTGIAIDESANCYITGNFTGTASFGDNPITATGGGTNIYVAKIDSNGSWLWAKQAGGTYPSGGTAIAIDGNGNCLVTGSYYLDVNIGGTAMTGEGDEDVFVAKLDASGNWLWASHAGGTGKDVGLSISSDSTGNCYLAGKFAETATFGTNNYTSNGNSDAFVSKLDSTGNWIWTRTFGAINADEAKGIKTYGNGSSLVTGLYRNAVNVGSHSISSVGSSDIYVAKIDSFGNWTWVKSAGGPGEDCSFAINLDSNGLCNITGYIQGTAQFGSLSITSTGYSCLYVARLSQDVSVYDQQLPGIYAGFSVSGSNPFRNELNLNIDAKVNTNISLKVYNLKGQMIETLAISDAMAKWMPRECAAGVYIVRMYQDAKPMQSMKVTYIK